MLTSAILQIHNCTDTVETIEQSLSEDAGIRGIGGEQIMRRGNTGAGMNYNGGGGARHGRE
jgi:hypothetical protein